MNIHGIPNDQISGDPTTTFKYTIREFDPNQKQLVVDYEDGSWAKIKLLEPLPGNRADLEAYIRQFTDPIERELALEDQTDMSFITDMLGNQYETGRRWLNHPPKPAPEPIEPEDQKMVDDIVNEILGDEVSSAAESAQEMMRVVTLMNKNAYLNTPGVFEMLTEESQKNVMASNENNLRQLQLCQKAINENKRFKATLMPVRVIFKEVAK